MSWLVPKIRFRRHTLPLPLGADVSIVASEGPAPGMTLKPRFARAPASIGLDRDSFRLGVLPLLEGHGQDSVLKAGVDLIGVD